MGDRTRVGPRLGILGGGVGLLASLFLPWSSSAGGNRSGFDVLIAADVMLAFGAVVAIAAAVTGGRIGLFRRDLSLNGGADLLGIVATLVVGWWLLFDVPAGGGAEAGAFIALGSAILIASAAGDYGSFRGEPAFPRLTRAQAPKLD